MLTSGRASPAGVMQLQRALGNQLVGRLLSGTRNYDQRAGAVDAINSPSAPFIQRLPYATAYSQQGVKTLLNKSEGRASPVNGQPGHPRQHVGRWEKAERFAEEQSKTKSVYTNTEQQDKAISSALTSGPGQTELAKLDATPGTAKRVAISNVATDAVDVKVVKAKKKKDTGTVKSWQYVAGVAQKATVIVDSMGTGRVGDIHIQTAFPVLD